MKYAITAILLMLAFAGGVLGQTTPTPVPTASPSPSVTPFLFEAYSITDGSLSDDVGFAGMWWDWIFEDSDDNALGYIRDTGFVDWTTQSTFAESASLRMDINPFTWPNPYAAGTKATITFNGGQTGIISIPAVAFSSPPLYYLAVNTYGNGYWYINTYTDAECTTLAQACASPTPAFALWSDISDASYPFASGIPSGTGTTFDFYDLASGDLGNLIIDESDVTWTDDAEFSIQTRIRMMVTAGDEELITEGEWLNLTTNRGTARVYLPTTLFIPDNTYYYMYVGRTVGTLDYIELYNDVDCTSLAVGISYTPTPSPSPTSPLPTPSKTPSVTPPTPTPFQTPLPTPIPCAGSQLRGRKVSFVETNLRLSNPTTGEILLLWQDSATGRNYTMGSVRYSSVLSQWYYSEMSDFPGDGRIFISPQTLTSGNWNIADGDEMVLYLNINNQWKSIQVVLVEHTGRNGVEWAIGLDTLGTNISLAEECSLVTPTPFCSPTPSCTPTPTPQLGTCLDIPHWFTATETSLKDPLNENFEEIEYKMNHIQSSCLDATFALGQGQLGANAVLRVNMTDGSVGSPEVVDFSLQSCDLKSESVPIRCLDTADYTFDGLLPDSIYVSWTDTTDLRWKMTTFNYNTEVTDNSRNLRLQRKDFSDTWFSDVFKVMLDSGWLGISSSRSFEPESTVDIDGSLTVRDELRVEGRLVPESGIDSPWNVMTTVNDVSAGTMFRTRNNADAPQTYRNFINGYEGQLITIFVDDIIPEEPDDAAECYTTFDGSNVDSNLRLKMDVSFATQSTWRPDGKAVIQFVRADNIWYEVSRVADFTDDPAEVDPEDGFPDTKDQFVSNLNGGSGAWEEGSSWAMDPSKSGVFSKYLNGDNGYVLFAATSGGSMARKIESAIIPSSLDIGFSHRNNAALSVAVSYGDGSSFSSITDIICSASPSAWSSKSVAWTVPTAVQDAGAFFIKLAPNGQVGIDNVTID